jgi:CHASE3 domain sensor protein
MPLAAIVRRIRSFSLSIGQLTFGSFMLLLAMIVMTSVASVVSIRHIGATFAELQHLENLGDVAEEIDRRMNELRLAARDFVTDPATPSNPVWEAASSLSALLKNTRLQLAPEQQQMIDGVSVRLQNYRDGIERVTALIAHRAELVAALPPVRARLESTVSEVADPVAIVATPEGAATVATYTVVHGRDGASERAVLICDLPGGGRCYALLGGGEAALSGAEAEELIGRTVDLAPADGINHAHLR